MGLDGSEWVWAGWVWCVGLDEWGWNLRWCQQRDALIKLRNDNPGIRIRTPDQLGVRSKLVRTRTWRVGLTCEVITSD